MKATFRNVKLLVLEGHWVACKRRGGRWAVFSSVGIGGGLQSTRWGKTIEDSLRKGRSSDHHHEKFFKEEIHGEYKVVTPAPKILKVGDKVRILDSYKENVKGWYPMILWTRSIFEITQVNPGGYTLINEKKKNSQVPYWAVFKIPEAQVHKMTQKEIEKELGYKFEVIPNDESDD